MGKGEGQNRPAQGGMQRHLDAKQWAKQQDSYGKEGAGNGGGRDGTAIEGEGRGEIWTERVGAGKRNNGQEVRRPGARAGEGSGTAQDSTSREGKGWEGIPSGWGQQGREAV